MCNEFLDETTCNYNFFFLPRIKMVSSVSSIDSNIPYGVNTMSDSDLVCLLLNNVVPQFRLFRVLSYEKILSSSTTRLMATLYLHSITELLINNIFPWK